VGNNAAVSSATDIYGLGAVFYHLLTGHPPFAGGTTYETIRLLLDTEPRQPRLLNPKIDRDMATICLKCLEKDPKRRYSSSSGAGRRPGTLVETRTRPGTPKWSFHPRKEMGAAQSEYHGNGGDASRLGRAIRRDNLENRIRAFATLECGTAGEKHCSASV
jgi:serine/threonine protein kinase